MMTGAPTDKRFTTLDPNSMMQKPNIQVTGHELSKESSSSSSQLREETMHIATAEEEFDK